MHFGPSVVRPIHTPALCEKALAQDAAVFTGGYRNVSSLWQYKARQHICKSSPLGRALNETAVYPRGDFPPVSRRSSETVRDKANVTIINEKQLCLRLL